MIGQWALIIAGLCYFVAAFNYSWHKEYLLTYCFILWGTANIVLSFIKGVK